MGPGNVRKKTNKGDRDHMILTYKLEWQSRDLTGKKGVKTISGRAYRGTNRNVAVTLSCLTPRAA